LLAVREKQKEKGEEGLRSVASSQRRQEAIYALSAGVFRGGTAKWKWAVAAEGEKGRVRSGVLFLARSGKGAGAATAPPPHRGEGLIRL